jgi:acetyl esterase/lipase
VLHTLAVGRLKHARAARSQPEVNMNYLLARSSVALLTGWAALALSATPAASPGLQAKSHRDLVYATIDDKVLKLDLHLPAAEQPLLLVWVHGGAWRSGSKDEVPPGLVDRGIAVASVDYRLSTEARFPAMIHDIKAAIRFLRARAAEYGYRAERVAIGGSSAGAHLATLVGVTNGHPELEGRVGAHLTQSSDVHAILSYYGASNLTTILAQSTPFGLDVRRPALQLFLGALPDDARALAELASPVRHVDRSDPPLLLLHGDQDPQMPINQSHEIEGAYESLGLDVAFDVVHGAAHGGSLFHTPARADRSVAFLRRTL